MLQVRGVGLTANLPPRPCLAPWYRLAEDGDRLVLEHGGSVVVLEGRAVRSLLPALLPRLDGTRTVDELVAELGEPARPAVEAALEALARRGLLVDGPEPDDAPGSAARALAAAYASSPGEVAGRLAGARVGIAGSGEAGLLTARLLRAAGLLDIRRLGWDAAGEIDLVVAAPGPAELAGLDELNRVALERTLAWLAIRPFDGRRGLVGPLVVPWESCCGECVRRRLAAHLPYRAELPALDGVPVRAGTTPPLDALAAGVASHLALAWLAARDASLPGVLYSLETAPVLALEGHDVLRVPRCPACSPAAVAAPRLPWHEAEIAGRVETGVEAA